MVPSTPITIKNDPPSPSPSTESDTSDFLRLDADDGWEDAEPEEEQLRIVSLIDEAIFPDVLSMLIHCKKTYDFDFLEIRERTVSDFYDTVKLVNFIRAQVKAGKSVTSAITRPDFDNEKFLKPVLQDDALLFNLDDLPDISYTNPTKDASAQLLTRIAELEEGLRRSQSQFADYRETVRHTLDDRWNESILSSPRDAGEEKHIHEVMLKDTIRTDAYRDFIYGHKHLFAGKIILDVGCGTGILSMFCAKAGAAKVIAVDNSAIIEKARENIFLNGLSSTVICLRGKIEEITLPVEKVDVIVSEWMGYCLLYEAMLDSVIWARDRYLTADGLMVPSHVNLWMAPIADPEYISDHVSFWRDVYGFDMKPMQAGIHEDALILEMSPGTLVTEPYPFLQLNLHEVSTKDLVFRRKWEGRMKENIDCLDGFVIWFDTFFMPSRANDVLWCARAEDWTKREFQGTAFTTGPYSRETHWRQGVLLVDNTIASQSFKRGDCIGGEIEYSVGKENSRALDIKVTWSSGARSVARTQSWKME
ncbi:MAG: hypothetical protein M1818_000841 [Claussenomyces sp. TS43310]|nr:MAG: hypothetical protein M1818_000841 [Claussenomyces sp. TS43310]